MFDLRLRRLTANALAPVARPFHGVPADVISAVGAGVGVAAAVAAAYQWWLVALVAWLVNRLVDGLDGLVARATESPSTASDAGGYLDMTLDIVVYAALTLGIAAGVGTEAGWRAAAVALASFYLNTITWAYLSALLEKRGRDRAEVTSITMPPGLIEGAETIVLFALILALPAYAVELLWLTAVLVTVGAVLRFVGGHRQLSKGENP